MNTSYIRGNAIHHSNNRACTLHDISNTTVEHNVAYNIKGLTFFLEDGVEMYNTIQYNLAIFTRMSNSLLNPDISSTVGELLPIRVHTQLQLHLPSPGDSLVLLGPDQALLDQPLGKLG